MEYFFKPQKDAIIRLIPSTSNKKGIYHIIYEQPKLKMGDFVRFKHSNINNTTYVVISIKYDRWINMITICPIDNIQKTQTYSESYLELDTSYYRKLKLQKLLTNV